MREFAVAARLQCAGTAAENENQQKGAKHEVPGVTQTPISGRNDGSP